MGKRGSAEPDRPREGETAQNVALVREGIEAFNQSGPEAILGMTHPDVFLEYTGVLIDKAQAYHGREGLLELLVGSWEDFDDVQVSIERTAGSGDCVVAGVVIRARGRASAAPIELRPAYVLRMRDGKVFYWRICTSYEEAIEVAGAAAASVTASDGSLGGGPVVQNLAA
ncbi:MAG: hypothetical protein NVSMB51_06750 [Solirubrobacteraceae bacterium]